MVLRIKGNRVRENRVGSYRQNELIIECELGTTGRSVNISIVLTANDDVNHLYNVIANVVKIGNDTIEKASKD